jgi:hypothetical protein
MIPVKGRTVGPISVRGAAIKPTKASFAAGRELIFELCHIPGLAG